MTPPRDWPGMLAVLFGIIGFIDFAQWRYGSFDSMQLTAAASCLYIGRYYCEQYQVHQMHRMVDGKKRTWW